jgi:predicted DNA binding protein
MTLMTRVYAKHPDLALTHTIQALPDGKIGVVSDVGTDPRNDAHYFWIEASDFDVVEEALSADPTVADWSGIVQKEDRRTYRITYSDEAKLLTPTVGDLGGLTVDSETYADGWVLTLQLPDHATLYELNTFVHESGMHLDILELEHSAEVADRRDYGLTEFQREALLAAYVHGYYDDPRETTLEGLTEYLDITPTAVSGRLKRGSAQLIREVLMDDDHEESDSSRP